jgi:hypothetical protein
MSISQITRNCMSASENVTGKKYLTGGSDGHGPVSRTCTPVIETTIAGNSCFKKVLAES